MKSDQHNTILIVGASRGLGHAMAATFLQHGWRSSAPCAIYHPTRRSTTWPRRIPCGYAWRRSTFAMKPSWPRCRRRFPASLDMLFVNAGTTNRDPSQTIGDVSTEEFYQVMLTNALAPMRVIERLQQAVKPQGLLGVMSSGQERDQ